MIVIFPSDPLNSRKIDSAFEREVNAAKIVGLDIGAVNLDGETPHINIRQGDGETAVYRGWMRTAAQYRMLYSEMWRRGYRLVNTQDEYRYCHELPQWYPDFEGLTPESVWFEDPLSFEDQLDGKKAKDSFELDRIITEVDGKLGPGPYIVKDFVKSRKHEWDTACFIPDIGKLSEITRAFLELQDDDLNGGLVFRQYAPLKRVGTHPKSGAPVHNEVRVWVLSGVPLMVHSYWGPDEGGNNIIEPENLFDDEVGRLLRAPVSSNFYTIDLAQQTNGRWVIIELGDGQVSGLPEHVLAPVLYESLKKRFTFR